jgi:hypothetical protein
MNDVVPHHYSLYLFYRIFVFVVFSGTIKDLQRKLIPVDCDQDNGKRTVYLLLTFHIFIPPATKLFIFVCFIYSRLSNFSAIRRLSPIPVKDHKAGALPLSHCDRWGDGTGIGLSVCPSICRCSGFRDLDHYPYHLESPYHT